MKIISRKEAKELGLKTYYTGKKCKHGHLSERHVTSKGCIGCLNHYRKNNKDKLSASGAKYYANNKSKKLKYSANQYKKNKAKIIKRQAEYRSENPTRELERKAIYRASNKELIKENHKKWRDNNKEKVLLNSSRHRRNNPEVYFARGMLSRVFSNWKGTRSEAEFALGYTLESLKSRIEFQFKDGMSWANRGQWHLDHKKPVSRFIRQGVTDPRIINALSNLQPLWANENLSKGDKF